MKGICVGFFFLILIAFLKAYMCNFGSQCFFFLPIITTHCVTIVKSEGSLLRFFLGGRNEPEKMSDMGLF